MRLAEAGGRMDEQRIEAHRQAGLRFRDALCGRMGEAVRSAGDEALEGLARIKRRAALRHRLTQCRDRLRHCPGRWHGLVIARDAPFDDVLRTLRYAPCADLDMHIVEMAELGFARLEELLGVVRLDPVPEETGGDRDREAAIGAFLRLHAGKPACVEIIAEFRFEPLSDPVPALLELRAYRIRHHA
jgi:hypothetical protein